jgi:hypothetical protein
MVLARPVIRRSVLLAMIAIALTASGASFAHAQSATAASVRHCGNAFASPDQPGFDVRVKHMACSSARRVTREWVRECAGQSPCRVHGFRCVKRRTVDTLYRVHCARLIQRFSFGGGS